MSIEFTTDHEANRRSTKPSAQRSWLFFIFMIVVGCVLNVAAYESFEVLLVLIFFFLTGFSLTINNFFGGFYERKIYRTMFAVTWVFAGVSAIYANWFGDVGQNYSDAAGFYELAAGKVWKIDLEHLLVLSEGSVAIFLWGAIYDIAAMIGLEKAPYIGILTNMSFVSFTGVIGIRISKLLFGNAPERLDRFIVLFSSCGLFWLFAAIHLRDSLVLLVITGLLYTWVRYLTRSNFFDLMLAVTFSILSGILFRYLRDNFVFVPLVIATMAFGCSLFFKKMNIGVKAFGYAFLFCLVIASVSLGYSFLSYNVDQILASNQSYITLSADSHSSSSLGMNLILSQPLLIRVVLGSGYLFLFPIPFWTGFQLESAYSLLKSANVIFFYFLVPLLVLAALRIRQNSNLRTPSIMFLLSVLVGFVVAVSATSLETRHFGAFLVPAMILSLIPDLSSKLDLNDYKVYLALYLILVALIHVSWAIMKY